MENSSLRIIQADFSGENDRQRVSRSGRKTFKACRKCRELKLRCDGRNDGPDSRCRRCYMNSLECIFDLAGQKGKRVGGAAYDGRPKRRRQTQESHSPNRVSRSPTGEMEPPVGTTDDVARSTRSQIPAEQRRRSSLSENGGGVLQVSADFTKGLTAHDLRAPVSAVHHMSTPEERMTNDTGPTVTSPFIETQRQPAGMSGFLGRMDVGSDIMSKGLVQQSQARKLFNLFMTCAGNFMPIFDPVMDTFDSLRVREPFCFAVIVALASYIEDVPDFSEESKSMVRDEVKRLAAQSLFKRPTTLGRIQAMLLLAAYTDEAYFAIGHAMQMAKDLKLDCALRRLVATHETQIISFKEQKHLIRQVRIWLALCFIEREIAAGTATSSRIEPIDIELLQKLRSHRFYTASDLRLTSLVEIVQIRESFQQEIGRAFDHPESAVERLMKIEKEYKQWLDFWDDLHDEYGFDQSSFQRASLRGQKYWATMFTGCTILGRLQKEADVTTSSAGELEGPAKDLIKYIVNTAMDQLRFILGASDYRWNLRWATNYSALSVTFAVVFVLNAARIYGECFDRTEILKIANEIAHILQSYPHPHFYRLVCLLINLTTNGPLPAAEADMENITEQHNGTVSQRSIHRMADQSSSNMAPEAGPPAYLNSDFSLEALLDDHLQDAGWMLEPSSITALNFPGEENMTIFDQGFSLADDSRPSTY